MNNPAHVEEKVVKANIGASLNMFKTLASNSKREKNLLMSPVSISAGMAMVHLGAKGASAKQIDDVFQFSTIHDSKYSAFSEVYSLLSNKGGVNTTLKLCNRAFVDQRVRVQTDFSSSLQTYQATVDTQRFSTHSDKAVVAVNKWIEMETGGKIKDLLEQSSDAANIKLFLANTVYFRGDWKNKFYEAHTHERTFYVSHYKVVKTPFMFQRGKFNYHFVEDAGVHVLEMPYEGEEFSMIVLLPDHFDYDKLIEDLNPEALAKWTSNLERRSVDIAFPKFTLEESLNVEEILPKMGITDIFDQKRADLSGIAKMKPNLAVSKIAHKAVFEVEEDGGFREEERVEAAKDKVPELVLFYADHPFVFALRNNKNGMLHAIGSMKRPEGSAHDEL